MLALILKSPAEKILHLAVLGEQEILIDILQKQESNYFLSRQLDSSSSSTKQPPAKAGGLELRTESPDTRRLNDASYSGSILKLSFGFGSK